jgi:serine/threonine protein phosphatase PrpC
MVSPGMGPAIEFAERTDPGRDPSKQVNEDASGYRQTRLGHLAVVCDGMGGHEGGREASHLALRTIFEIVDRGESGPALPSPAMVLREAIEEANRRVFALPQEQDGARPGATVVAILHHEGGTEVAHVGDSRVYLIHGADVVQLTKDHSLVQQMVDRGLLLPEQAVGHPDANKISRALGMKADVEVEVRPQPVAHVIGDVFVLCSDGLSDLVVPADILRIAGGAPAKQAAGQLVDLANARGGHDNITVQILRSRTTAAGSSTTAVLPTVVDTQPPPPVASAAVPVIPSAPSVPRPRGTFLTTEHGHTRSPIVIVGLLLGLLGLGLAGVAVHAVLRRPEHKLPVVPDAAPVDAAVDLPPPPPPPEPVDAEVPPVPELDPSSHPRHRRDR